MPQSPVVVVVEDDVEMNQLQCELLDLYGLRAVAAYTGTEALDVINHNKVDAVLLDVMLPELDGFETCRQLRNALDKSLPIVMVTALDNEECRRRGYEAGADAYFAKPFDPDEVIETIRMLISKNLHGDGDTAGGS